MSCDTTGVTPKMSAKVGCKKVGLSPANFLQKKLCTVKKISSREFMLDSYCVSLHLSPTGKPVMQIHWLSIRKVASYKLK